MEYFARNPLVMNILQDDAQVTDAEGFTRGQWGGYL
jgi:hypothetical protein